MVDVGVQGCLIYGWRGRKRSPSSHTRRRSRMLAASVATLSLLVPPTLAASEGLEGELAFVRLSDGFWQVWSQDLSTGQERQRTKSRFDKRHPTWDAQGALYFRSNNDELYFLAPGADKEEEFRPDLWPAVDPAPARSSPSIALVRLRTDVESSAIYLIPIEGGKPRILASGPGLRRQPTWGPDDRILAFVRALPPRTSVIERVELATGSVEPLVSGDSRNRDPCYSPDGASLAYVSDRGGRDEVWIHRDGTPEVRLARFAGSVADPVWSPDGRRIAFTAYRDGKFAVWVVGRDGEGLRELVGAIASTRDPAWR